MNLMFTLGVNIYPFQVACSDPGLQQAELTCKKNAKQMIRVMKGIYTTWKVDGATPMYLFLMASYQTTIWELHHLLSLWHYGVKGF